MKEHRAYGSYPHNSVHLLGSQVHTHRCILHLSLDGTELSCHMCGSRHSKDSLGWTLSPLCG